MSNQRISESLAALFENHPVVFWHDVDAEFTAIVDSLPPQGVQLVRLDATPALQIKIDIERNLQQRWLLYSTQQEPEPAKDWLLDVRLRSKSFRADTASILLEDLGLTTQTLRFHLKDRAKFLRAKERVERLKRLVSADDGVFDLDRKMLQVLTRADQDHLFNILLRLFAAMDVEGQVDLDSAPKAWLDIENNDLAPAFWSLVRSQLGYQATEPSLRDLLIHILVTDLCRGIDGEQPRQLAHFVLNDRALAANASVFAARWRSDLASFRSYNTLACAVAKELSLSSLLAGYSAEQLADCMTFEEAELRIVQNLKQRILVGAGANMDAVHELIARRRDGHWANALLGNANDHTRALAACYDALTAAADFLHLKANYADGFSFVDAATGFHQYRTDLYRFDQLYRHFHTAADAVEPMGWAVLHELRDTIENMYSGWFVPQLAAAWGKVVDGDKGLLSHWSLSDVTPQQQFYEREVQRMYSGGAKRVFVVISDALRYEVAQELVQSLNSKNRFKAILDSMLGVLPSYTALGMAALLPHKTLAYKESSNLDVLVDGQLAATLEQRNEHLKAFGGMAIKAEDLLALGKEKGRALVRDYEVVYVYHDRIDMTGDKQASESKTFEAAALTVKELSGLLGFIINSLNGSNVLVTADHGFIYQESPLETADKAALEEKPAGTLKAKKRYLLGRHLGQNSMVWAGNTQKTAGTTPEGSLDFWVPKGASRFHFAGGARFVHGSAMPQEVVIPVIKVRVSDAESAKTQQVGVSLLGNVSKMVNSSQRFEFIQTEAVTERMLARTVVVAIRDGDKPISDEQTITFDSTAQMLDERKKSIFLTVHTGAHDLHRSYDVVVRDVSTKVELIRSPIKIDLAFGNDF